MDAAKPYKFIGFGAMDPTKPYKFIGFGALSRGRVHDLGESHSHIFRSIGATGFPGKPSGSFWAPLGCLGAEIGRSDPAPA